MLAQDACYLSIAEAAAAFRRKQLSPVELTRLLLDRIDAVDGNVNSYVTRTDELAMAQARQAEIELAAGNDRGPLHGIPIALKDLYQTAGIRTTAHSRVLADWVPSEDAAATARLQEAGMVLLGKLAMSEFALGGPSPEQPFPPARNPWNLERMPGGSSSGSGAALAAGLCLGTLGSDTGGSIRGPASMCGISGIKPTYGLVSRYGVVPLAWSLDHAGPMARTAEDCALLLQAIAGHDPRDPASANVPVPDYRATLNDGVRGLRLGVPRSWFAAGEYAADADILAAVDAALGVLEQLGATIVEVDGAPFAAARSPNSTIMIAEAYAYHEQTLRERPEDYGAVIRGRFRQGAFLSAADYIQAQRVRSRIIAEVNDILRTVDALVMPTSASPAQPFGDIPVEMTLRTLAYTSAFNLTGLPAISIPCGFNAAGLPLSLQIAGHAFDDATVLRIAHVYQQVTDWHQRRPAL